MKRFTYYSSNFSDVLPRAHAKKFSGACQHDDKQKICKNNLLLRPKATTPIFSHLLFFCCQNVAQQKRKIFCLENFSQKFFPTSLVTLVTGGVILRPPMYLHHMHTSGTETTNFERSDPFKMRVSTSAVYGVMLIFFVQRIISSIWDLLFFRENKSSHLYNILKFGKILFPPKNATKTTFLLDLLNN